jgi:hypothetical protein
MADILGSASFDQVSLESPNTIALQQEASNLWTAFTAQTDHQLLAFLKSEIKLSGGKPGLNLKTVIGRLEKQPQGFECSAENEFAQYASRLSCSSLQVLRQFRATTAARRAAERHAQRPHGNRI